MAMCSVCDKKTVIRAYSRHKKGSSGGTSGTWSLKAQISKKPQNPNLHLFKGNKFCTKCLRVVKADFNKAMSSPRSQATT